MMIDLYTTFKEPLTHEMLHKWHLMLMQGRNDLHNVGAYRTHEESMQIISGASYNPKVHFEAPPSSIVETEMDAFITWFNKSIFDNLPAMTRASIAHLYFVSIHPFEDGNGRIARAISEKALSQAIKQPTLISLATTIEKRKKRYYKTLEDGSKNNEITNWIEYFSDTIIEAQLYTQELVDFLILKTKFFDRFEANLNERQMKVVLRMFKEGPKGFDGGLSAENYFKIANTSRATATRDLSELVEKNILLKSGKLKGTKYHLNLSLLQS